MGRRRLAIAFTVVLGCTSDGDLAGDGTGEADTSFGAGSDSPTTTTTTTTATSAADTSTSEGDGTTGEPPPDEPPPPAPEACGATITESVDPVELPDDYGFAVEPPTMALAESFYSYDARTNIGACSTDRVRWRLESAPAGARLEIGDTSIAAGEEHQHDGGGAPRESAKLAWDLADVAPGCHAIEIRWQAWRDCGALDDGDWGPWMRQSFELSVRENHWYSGDLHVHTRHSERDDDAGGAHDYYRRMINEATNDSGLDFADRRERSMRGRLHWLVFSEHTNNEQEECGRHFATWCGEGEDLELATGRDVVRTITEEDPSVLLVVGSEISNKFDGHFGFLPRNPFPGHPIYAPDVLEGATDYDIDVGYGPGVFRERWVDEGATNQEEIDLIHEMGGLAIVNHESAPTFWIEYDWTSLDFDGLEVWNGGNRHDRFDDGAYHGGIDLNDVTGDDLLETELPEDPLERSWIGMIKHGRWPMVLVGGSDVHDYNEVVCEGGPCDPTNAELATPTTTVWAPEFVWTDGAHGVFDGLARGRVVVHDKSNFIDLRATSDAPGYAAEYVVGDTIAGYAAGEPISLRAFGRVASFVDGDNRVLLVLGTSGDADDRGVDVLYSSEDDDHFVESLQGKDHMRYIRPDSSFDRGIEITLDETQLGASGTYFVWAQFVPWHNPVYLDGNGQDMAQTGAMRITTAE